MVCSRPPPYAGQTAVPGKEASNAAALPTIPASSHVFVTATRFLNTCVWALSIFPSFSNKVIAFRRGRVPKCCLVTSLTHVEYKMRVFHGLVSRVYHKATCFKKKQILGYSLWNVLCGSGWNTSQTGWTSWKKGVSFLWTLWINDSVGLDVGVTE